MLDGNEGCGKSTQSLLLRDALLSAGVATLAVRDPGSTAVGEQIRALLLNPANASIAMRCEMLLYMAARAQMMSELILPALAAGKAVLCDRFVSSTLAYQLGGEGLSADEIRQAAEVAIQGRWPDLTILLDMPPELAMARVKRDKDRIEQRPLAYHRQVRENFLAQARQNPRRIRVASADLDPQAVHQQILEIIAETFDHD